MTGSLEGRHWPTRYRTLTLCFPSPERAAEWDVLANRDLRAALSELIIEEEHHAEPDL